MKIQVHIDRLVLDGLPVRNRESKAINEAIEKELTRLLAEGRLPEILETNGAFTRLPAGTMKVAENNPSMIGTEIARAIYRGIGQ